MRKLFTCLMLMVGMLLPLSATAADLQADLTIYYDVSTFGDFSGKKLQVMIGHGSYSTTYEMKAVEGYDNLYSVNIGEVNSGNTWGGATQLGFMAADAIWGGESNGSSSQPKERIKWASMYSGIYNITSTLSGNVLFTGKDALSITKDYKLPAKTPVITIGAAPEFATTTVGETSTVTVKYTVENSEEKPEISLDNDAFTAEDVEGTITITFAPTEAKEYTATLTIAIGDIKETVDLVATGVAADAPKVPEILNLKAGEISAIYVGETTEFEVTYELANAEEATASIEGEGFTIKEQEVGTATIEFAPTEAKTYSAVITVTSGDVTKTLEIEATAKKVPTVITISFVNSEKWEEVALYAWGADGLPSSWPGEKMTKGDNDTYTYQLTVPEDGEYSFIINNNLKDNATQTVDVEGVAESTCYNLGQKNAEGKYSLVVATNCTSDPVPTPELEFALVGRLNGDNDTEILDYASGYKFTKESEFVYTLNVTFTGTIESSGKQVQKVKLVDAQGNIWARNSSKTIYIQGTEGEYVTATMTKGETKSSAYLVTEAGVEYKITYTLNDEKTGGQITFEKVEVPEPELIVSTEEVVFETLILDGEQFSSTETIRYEIKNSDETAVIALESDVFDAKDENGTITITFTPIFNNYLYKAELTITLGDIVKTVAISAVVKPLIDDILLPEFDDTKVGEYDEIEVLYSLHKGNEGVARIDGDPAFEITSQEVGRMFIKFTPKEVKEYTANLILTSGKFERKITLIANGLAPDPEHTTITIKVAVPEVWEGCNLWAWDVEGNNLFDAWPGEAMEKGTDGFYTIDVAITNPINFKVSYDGIESQNYTQPVETSTCFNLNALVLEVNETCEYQAPIEMEAYYAIRGLNGDTDWSGDGDIKMTPNADNTEYSALGFTTDGTAGFKVIYVDNKGAVADYYGTLEDGVTVSYTLDPDGNIILSEGTYNLYFKTASNVIFIENAQNDNPDIPTDIEEAEVLNVYAANGTIYAADDITIYTLAGVDVTAQNGSLYGVYIVTTLNGNTLISVW